MFTRSLPQLLLLLMHELRWLMDVANPNHLSRQVRLMRMEVRIPVAVMVAGATPDHDFTLTSRIIQNLLPECLGMPNPNPKLAPKLKLGHNLLHKPVLYLFLTSPHHKFIRKLALIPTLNRIPKLGLNPNLGGLALLNHSHH